MSNYSDHDQLQQEKLDRAKASYEDESTLKAVALIVGENQDLLREMRSRIVKNCGQISDGDLGQESPQFQELREIGMELHALGGFAMMKLFCDSIAGEYAQMKWRTDKGNSYLIGSLCNSAWNGIGDWVA